MYAKAIKHVHYSAAAFYFFHLGGKYLIKSVKKLTCFFVRHSFDVLGPTTVAYFLGKIILAEINDKLYTWC